MYAVGTSATVPWHPEYLAALALPARTIEVDMGRNSLSRHQSMYVLCEYGVQPSIENGEGKRLDW